MGEEHSIREFPRKDVGLSDNRDNYSPDVYSNGFILFLLIQVTDKYHFLRQTQVNSVQNHFLIPFYPG